MGNTITGTLEPAVVVKALGSILMRKHIYRNIEDLVGVVMVVVFCGSILTHLETKNKESCIERSHNKEDKKGSRK